MFSLSQAFLEIRTDQEIENFLKDILTPKERSDLEGRWKAAQLLNKNEKSYREIASETGMSVTTIGRVSRFLKDEPYQGYGAILKKLNKSKSVCHHGR